MFPKVSGKVHSKYYFFKKGGKKITKNSRKPVLRFSDPKGSIILVEDLKRADQREGLSGAAVPSWVVFHLRACFIILYCVSVLSSPKESKKNLALSEFIFLSLSSLLDILFPSVEGNSHSWQMIC